MGLLISRLATVLAVMLGCYSRNKKNILFVVRNDVMLSYASPVYSLLVQDPRLNLQMCVVPKGKLTKTGYKNSFTRKMMRQKKISVILFGLAKYLFWDLTIYPDHYRPFRKDCKKIYNGKKIYIGHGLHTGKKVDGENYQLGHRALNDDGTWIYDKLFVESSYVSAAIKTDYPDAAERVRVVGNLLMEDVLNVPSEKSSLFKKASLSLEKKTIMVMSTWGPNSFINNVGLEFLKKVKGITEHFNLVMTIHLNNYIYKQMKNVDWQIKFNEISTCPNLHVLAPGADPYPWLKCADLIITDVTSLGLYYTVLERPVIYYDNEFVEYEKVSLSREMRDAAYRIREVSNIEHDIEAAFRQFDVAKMHDLAVKINDRMGKAKQRYREEIYDSLDLDEQKVA